jgi:hypothetical protein
VSRSRLTVLAERATGIERARIDQTTQVLLVQQLNALKHINVY